MVDFWLVTSQSLHGGYQVLQKVSTHGCRLAIAVAWRLLLVHLLPPRAGQAEKSSFGSRYRFGTSGGRLVTLESHAFASRLLMGSLAKAFLQKVCGMFAEISKNYVITSGKGAGTLRKFAEILWKFAESFLQWPLPERPHKWKIADFVGGLIFIHPPVLGCVPVFDNSAPAVHKNIVPKGPSILYTAGAEMAKKCNTSQPSRCV